MREDLTFFPCGDTTMAGILTHPEVENGICVIVVWGAGAFPSSARNQYRARLARELAANGYHAFRFDYPGVGEAGGEYRVPTLSTPYVPEVLAAVDWLRTRGMSRFAIVANCFGAWSSLVAAPQIDGLETMALINSPVRREHQELRAGEGSWSWWKRKIKNLRWANLLSAHHRSRYRRLVKAKLTSAVGARPAEGRFVSTFEKAIAAGVNIRMIYGPDGFRADFDQAMKSRLEPLIENADAQLSVMRVEERIEGFPTLASQDRVASIVGEWLGARHATPDRV